jgi:hypothetical protein
MGATKSLLSYHHYIPYTSMDTGMKSSMEGPTHTDEALMPTEPNKSMSGTTSTLKRKVFTKACATDILVWTKDEYIPARKKPRLQTSFPATIADADTLNAYASPDAAGVAVAVAVAASADAGGTDPVAASPLKPNNAGAAQATQRRWTLEEDTKLTSAVNTTKKYSEEFYRTDWNAVSALLPGRTKLQCKNRWYSALDSKSDETIALVGRWTTDEDSTLKDAVGEKHNGNNWTSIAALVPGRTKQQCLNRWYSALAHKRDETTARVSKWTKEED